MKYEITSAPPSDFYRLRARVFHEILKWDVRVENGEERDRYDPAQAILVWDGHVLAGGMRLLPTTGPTLMSDVFPEIGIIRSPFIWECSRLCWLPRRESACDRQEHDRRMICMQLIKGLIEAVERAAITSLVAHFDDKRREFFRQAGLKFDILGQKAGVYFGLLEISSPLLEEVNRRLGSAHAT